MTRKWQIPRRTFLRGLGATMALPALEAMVAPIDLLAKNTNHTHNGSHPLRLAFVYVPNGANMADWKPKTEGTDFELPYILEPLKPVRNEVQVLTGLAQDKAFPNGDGAGDHARASATFLTGCQARKTAGADIHVGISVDQVAAQRLGRLTRLPSLELSTDQARQAGACDSGYSCAYQFNISWSGESTPLPPEANPRLVFERLFGNDRPAEMTESRARREHYRQSILDLVQEDARQLKAQLGRTDQRKLDEYLTSVRELERRVEQAEQFTASLPNATKPAGIPREYERHLELMFDLLALGFQTDTTRIASFMMAHDGSNKPYPFIGVSEGHHDLSHHQNKEEKKHKIARINHFHLTQFARFLTKLKSIPEGNGTLLDHCMIVYGSGLSDGNRHNHDDLPVLVAGGGAGTLTPGRHVKFSKTPMNNLYLALLERMGVPTQQLGDSTGILRGIGPELS